MHKYFVFFSKFSIVKMMPEDLVNTGRDGNKYQRANNVCVKNPISGNILRCFVKKVSNLTILRFWWHFLAHFGYLSYFLALFLYYSGVLGLLRCFLTNYIGHILHTFLGKIFLAQTMFL